MPDTSESGAGDATPEISKQSTSRRSTRIRTAIGIASALLLLAILPRYGVLLQGDVGSLSRDYGTVFLDTIVSQAKALQDGEILYWDPMQYSGTASWSRPNTAPIYPPLIVLVAVLGPALGLNVCVIAHLVFGALGVFLLARRATGTHSAGLLAAVVALSGNTFQLFAFVLPLEALALSFAPWSLLALLAGVESRDWRNAIRFGLLAGVGQALATWSGGYVTRIPSLVVLTSIAGIASLRIPVARNAAIGLATLTTFAISFVTLSAARLLPTQAWISITNRAQGVAPELAMWGRLDRSEMVAWFLRDGGLVTALLLCGVVIALTILCRRRSGTAVAYAAGFAVILLLCEGSLHKLLYEYVPGFSLIREPRRAWLLTPVVVPVLVAIAFDKLTARWSIRPRIRTGIAIAFAGVVAIEAQFRPSFERPTLTSVSERVASNALYQDLARRGESETRFRVHDYHLTRPQLKVTAELVCAELDLELLEGVLGNVWIPAYDNDFLELSRTSKAKAWGLLNVRYVTSRSPIEETHLTFVSQFRRDPESISPGIDGPFLYRNELELPRAAIIDHAILFIGASRLIMERWLASDRWDPKKHALVHARFDEVNDWPLDLIERFDVVAIYEEGRESQIGQALIHRLREAKVPTLELGSVPGIDVVASSPRFARTTTSPPTLRALRDPPRQWNAATIELPAQHGSSWLVLAETYAQYPGWSLSLTGAERDSPALDHADRTPPMLRSIGATIVPLTGIGDSIEFRYRPPGFRLGVFINLIAIALTGVLWFVLRGR